MRLFIAINLNKKMKDAIMDIQDDLMFHGISGNYTKLENMHLTLAFIGEYSDPEMVKDVVNMIDFEPFRISLDGMGSFGSLWWIGLKDSPELLRVAKQLRHSLASAGIPFDKKKFRPHITLVRKPSADIEIVPASLIDECKGASMTVDHISLMRSDRGKRGMIYTEL